MNEMMAKSIIRRSFLDTARVQMYNGTNDRGDCKYEPERRIDCRFDYEQKETVDSKGNKILSTATMLTSVFIPSLSIVYDENNNRFTVKSCKLIKRLSGAPDHYEVIL